MLVTVINAASFDSLLEQSNSLTYTSIIECRIDLIENFDMDAYSNFLNKITRPVIVTVRTPADGGQCTLSEAQRCTLLLQLIGQHPDYLDIEHHIENDVITALAASSPDTKLIRSYHNFNETPAHLAPILDELKHPSISVYKIACMANNTADALRLAAFTHQQSIPLAAHAMGKQGQCSRIMGPVIGSYFTYTSHEKDIAPGIVDQQTLEKTYYFSHLNKNTKFYALLGNPVSHSAGQIFHNQYFHEHHINGLYLKLETDIETLEETIKFIRQLPFKGLSITMPLKQSLQTYADHIDERATAIGAVNTVKFQDNSISLTNTDAPGALNALEEHFNVKDKHCVILGAGGSARAIAYEAKLRGAHVTVLNRTLEKATRIACAFNIKAQALDDPKPCKCDILINTIPEPSHEKLLQSPSIEALIQQKPFIMNINHQCDNGPLHKAAKRCGAHFIDGKKMYENQAVLQQHFWADA
jgi:3-dehydroquinate dehydratase / shikimate dehydrogenase